MIYLVLYTVYFGAVSTSTLSYVQRFSSKRELVKTFLCTPLKQINSENGPHIATESWKEGFNDAVFQHFVGELKHCNSDMQMDLQLLVPVFLCLCLIYLLVMLFFRMIFFHNMFSSISFPCEFTVCKSFLTRLICNF